MAGLQLGLNKSSTKHATVLGEQARPCVAARSPSCRETMNLGHCRNTENIFFVTLSFLKPLKNIYI